MSLAVLLLGVALGQAPHAPAPAAAKSASLAAAASPQAVSGGPLVLLDPGHGGADPGVSVDGLIESAVAMDVALKAAELLRARGVDVRLTHGEGETMAVSARVLAANTSGALAFVSLHVNHHFNQATNGPRVFTPRERPLGAGPPLWEHASAVQAPASKELGLALARSLELQGAKAVQHLRLAQFRGLAVPAALVELGFASHAETWKSLMDATQRARLAEQVAQGVTTYLVKGGRLAASTP